MRTNLSVPDFYLILDRADPHAPRLVVARACVSRPALVPDELDTPHGPAAGMAWLAKFGIEGFAWLSRIFGRSTALRVTQPGEECYATRISHNTPDVWPIDASNPASLTGNGNSDDPMPGGDYETGWTDDGTVFHYWDDTWDTNPDDDRP